MKKHQHRALDKILSTLRNKLYVLPLPELLVEVLETTGLLQDARYAVLFVLSCFSNTPQGFSLPHQGRASVPPPLIQMLLPTAPLMRSAVSMPNQMRYPTILQQKSWSISQQASWSCWCRQVPQRCCNHCCRASRCFLQCTTPFTRHTKTLHPLHTNLSHCQTCQQICAWWWKMQQPQRATW